MTDLLKAAAEWFSATVLARCLDLADYFIYKKRISVSEGFLLTIVLARGIWYPIFGVTGGIVDTLFNQEIWIAVYALLSLGHIASFLAHKPIWRVAALTLEGAMWVFLTVLAIMSRVTTPAAPTFAAFAVLSGIVAFRIYSDKTLNVE